MCCAESTLGFILTYLTIDLAFLIPLVFIVPVAFLIPVPLLLPVTFLVPVIHTCMLLSMKRGRRALQYGPHAVGSLILNWGEKSPYQPHNLVYAITFQGSNDIALDSNQTTWMLKHWTVIKWLESRVNTLLHSEKEIQHLRFNVKALYSQGYKPTLEW